MESCADHGSELSVVGCHGYLKGTAIVVDGFRSMAFFIQEESKTVMRFSVEWGVRSLQYFLKVTSRSVEFTLILEDDAEIIVGLDQIRLQLQRDGELCKSFVNLSLGSQESQSHF